MLDNLLNSIFDTTATTDDVTFKRFLICVLVSVLIGFVLSVSYMYKNKYTKSFVITLSLIPAVVCMIIMMVNNKIGASVAVAGAFSLVRFRSIPGTAKEIGAIFIAMSAGLVCGMGYILYAIVFVLILILMNIIYMNTGFGSVKNTSKSRIMTITIPEDLNFSDMFNDLFSEFTTDYELIKVKTTNLGSLFKLTYSITMKDEKKQKDFIDKIRCRNGNLEISISHQENEICEL